MTTLLRALWAVCAIVCFVLHAVVALALPSQFDPPVTQMAGGEAFTCLLTANGGVRCFGRNARGQLGDGTLVDRSVATDVPTLVSGVVKIAAGREHACALLDSGAVNCWGANDLGQLGDGSNTQRLNAVAVSGLSSGVASVIAGSIYSCALKANAAVVCWGGFYGPSSSSTPVPILGLEGGVIALAGGESHVCALTVRGGVKCWGLNSHGQVGDGSTVERPGVTDVAGLASGVTAIAAGGNHSCALLANGGVKCWGANDNGELGDGTESERLLPTDVNGISSGATAIAAGRFHSCALMNAGGIKCWGHGLYGQLGIGIGSTISDFPIDVVALGGAQASVIAGDWHTCAIAAGGGAKCWGWNAYGQLGNGTTTDAISPAHVLSHAGGVQTLGLGSSASFTCMHSNGDRVSCAGDNFLNPFAIAAENRKAVTVGEYHACALTLAGGVVCAGSNFYGQLGNGNNTSSTSAVEVTGLSSGVTQIAAGQAHTCALLATGAVKCWGNGGNAQLGAGNKVNSNVPADVVGLSSSVTAITAGFSTTCAIQSGGAKCWGYNSVRQGGVGTTTDILTPTDVTGLTSGIANISTGGFHTCAVTTGGAAKCWGSNDRGQLGVGNTAVQTGIVAVSGLSSGVASISAGFQTTCAVMTSGAVKCWGANSGGMLGDGSSVLSSSTPVSVAAPGNSVQSVAVGSGYACAVGTDGALLCWGGNVGGRFGSSTQASSSTPVVEVQTNQSVTFIPPLVMQAGAPATTLAATATSGLSVSFDTWTPTTCSVSGSAVTPTSAGLCGIRVSQSGDADHPAASPRLTLVPVAPAHALNIDNSDAATRYEPASDGVMLMRYLLGVRGSAVSADVMVASATRNAAEIEAHLAFVSQLCDVDGDGQILAMSDGLMILRRMLGLSGAALTAGAKRTARADSDIEVAIDALLP